MRRVSKTTPKNIHNRALRLVEVLRTQAQYSIKSKTYVFDEPVQRACARFDELLDDLLGEDFFGTEGQNDPRGDRRD